MTTEQVVDFQAELLEMKHHRMETLKIITQHGFVPDDSNWLTIARYAEKYGISPDLVNDWIDSGIIPTDCVDELPVLNNIKMVKDQSYR
jgi:hypothetical protein